MTDHDVREDGEAFGLDPVLAKDEDDDSEEGDWDEDDEGDDDWDEDDEEDWDEDDDWDEEDWDEWDEDDDEPKKSRSDDWD